MSVIGRKGKGKKKSVSSHTPQEAANTLQSKSIVRFLDLISEGPCLGIHNGLKGIYYDGTPFQNTDGSFNFNGVSIYERTGWPSQPYIPGFTSAENEVDVGVQVLQTSSVSKTISDDTVNAVRVKIRVPSLTYMEDDGDLVGNKVELDIQVKTNTGAFYTTKNVVIEGKTTSTYERAVRVELPAGGAPWTVRVVRITPDSTSARDTKDTYFSSYTELVDAKLTYPDCAYVAHELDAEAFGNRVQERTYHYAGLITPVPTNYDPITRTYTGLWNGTFKYAWHNNPAWVLYDLLTNTRYGLGDLIPVDTVDKFGLYAIGRYCDEMVPDGKGGFEPRYAFNGAIRSREEAVKVLDTVASALRGMIYWGAGSVMVTQDSPATPAKLVTQANVINGEFNYSGTPLSARATSVAVTWSDPSELGSPSIVIVQDDALIQKYGDRRREIAAVGCTSIGQAKRIGEWLLYTESHETELVTYRASLDHADVRPGHIISVADSEYAGVRFGGRLVSTSTVSGSFTLDAPVTLLAGSTYKIAVVTALGEVKSYNIINGAGEYTTVNCSGVSLSAGEVPVTGAMWTISATEANPRLFRVISNTEKSATEYEISAILHNPSKFNYIERDWALEESNFSIINTNRVTPPSGATLVMYERQSPGTISTFRMTAGWMASPDSRVVAYRLWVTEPNEPERFVGQFSNLSADFASTTGRTGTYTIRVAAVTYLDQMSSSITAAVNTNGLRPAPPVPTGWVGIAGHDVINLTGNPYTQPAFRGFRIYGAIDVLSTPVFLDEVTTTSYVRRVAFGDPLTGYYVSAAFHDGRESAKTNFIPVVPQPATLADLDQSVTDAIDAADQKAQDVRSDHDALIAEIEQEFPGRFLEIRNDIDNMVDVVLAESIIANQGSNVLVDPLFAEDGYTLSRYSGQGTFTKIDNTAATERYKVGQTLQFAVTNTQTDGIDIRSDIDTLYWTGMTNAKAYVVEAEFTLVSGTIGGAGVILDWDNNSGTPDNMRQVINFGAELGGEPVLGKPSVVTKVLSRPTQVGVFTRMQAILAANDIACGALTTKDIKFHRLQIRVAAPEEYGEGEVRSRYESYGYSKATVDTAITAAERRMESSVSNGRMPFKGTFDDLIIGDWAASGVSITSVPSVVPTGRSNALRSTVRLTTYGPLIDGNLNGQTFRIKGFVNTTGSMVAARTGFHVVDRTGASQYIHVPVVGANVGWTEFSVDVMITVDTKSFRFFLLNDGFSPTVMSSYWTDIEVYNVTQEITLSTILTEQYITEADALSADGLVKTELKADISTLKGSISGYQVIFENVIGTNGLPVAGSAPTKLTNGGLATITTGGVALGQTDTVIVRTGPGTIDTTGFSNGAYFTIPIETALSFGGKKVKISVLATNNGVINPATSFGISYGTNEVGNSGVMNAPRPLTSVWEWYDFYYTVPSPILGGTDFIGVWGDTTQTNLGTRIARIVVQDAAVAGDLPEIASLQADVTDILSVDTTALTGTAFAAFAKTARVAALQADGVLTSQYFPGSWLNYNTGPTTAVSTTVPEGNTLTWNLATGVHGGAAIQSDMAEWTGAKNMRSVTVEVDFTKISGSLLGAGVVIEWVSVQTGIHRAFKSLSSMVAAATVVNGVKTTGTFVANRADYAWNENTDTFSLIRVYVMANSPYFGESTDAKNIRFERLLVRSSSATEAEVTVHGSAIADLEGNASAAYVMRATAGASTSEVELVAWEDAANPAASGSSLRVRADNILLDGTVRTRLLAVKDFEPNLVFNGNFASGDLSEWVTGTLAAGYGVIAKNTATGVAANCPTKYMFKILSHTVFQSISQETRRSVVSGETLTVSFHAATSNSNGATALPAINYYDKAGTYIGFSAQDFTISNTWAKYKFDATVPANAVECVINVERKVKTTQSPELYVTSVEVLRKRAAETIIKPGSITTGLVAANSITADELSVGFSGNRLVNSDYAHGTLGVQHWASGTIGAGSSMYTTYTGHPWGGYDYPVLELNTTALSGSTGSCAIAFKPPNDSGGTARGYPAVSGGFYEFHANVSIHRCYVQLAVNEYNKDGTFLRAQSITLNTTNAQGTAGAPETYPRIGGVFQTGANTAFIEPYISIYQSTNTNSANWSHIFIHHPFLGETTSQYASWSRYSPGPLTYIAGGSIVTGSITAGKIAAGQINSGHIQAGSINAGHIQANSITAGSAIIGSAAIDTLKLAGNSVTIAASSTSGVAGAQSLSNMAAVSLYIPYTSRIIVMYDVNLWDDPSSSYFGTSYWETGHVRIWQNSTMVLDRLVLDLYLASNTKHFSYNVGPGNYQWLIQWGCSAPTVRCITTLTVFAMMR